MTSIVKRTTPVVGLVCACAAMHQTRLVTRLPSGRGRSCRRCLEFHTFRPVLPAKVWTFPTQGFPTAGKPSQGACTFPTSGETPDGHHSRPGNHDPAQLNKGSPLPLSEFNLTKIDFPLKWSDLGQCGDAWSTTTTWGCFGESQNKTCACNTMCPMLVGDVLCKDDSIPSSSRLYPRASCMA